MFRKNKFARLLVIILFTLSDSLFSFTTDQEIFLLKLNSVEGLRYSEIKHDSTYSFAYQIYFPQRLDHKNPASKTFSQRLFIYHRSYQNPMVFITEGYNAVPGRHSELTDLLNSNEIIVEHRFFGKSCPDSLNWEYLTTEQAANDHHSIILFFKDLYRSKWVSTGISKGGQTTIMLKYYFPSDVEVSVPYVAPLNLEQEDHRIYQFLDTVGSKEQRDKITSFQRLVLKNREQILPLFEQYINDHQLNFQYDINLIFEYTVFEYSFSFWQWGHKTDNIPDFDSSPEVLFEHLINVSDPSYFSTKEMDKYAPFMYQAYNEEGYYGYETREFTDLLVSVKTEIASSRIFAPNYESIVYKKELMKNIDQWLRFNGNNILYIYGGSDTWCATAVDVGTQTNSVKMVKAGGSHKTRIRHFSDEEKEIIYSNLENWLDIAIPFKKLVY